MNVCNKIGYSTVADAKWDLKLIDAQVRRFNKRNRTTNYNKKQHIYQCDKCGMYHLTSMSKQAVKRLQKQVKK